MKRLKPGQWRWPLVIVLTAAIPITLFFQEQMRELFFIPLAYLVLEASIYIDSIPQVIFWLFLLLFVLLAMIRSLVGVRKSIPMDERRSVRRMGAVESWLAWIYQAEQGNYYRGRLARRQAELAIKLIAHRRRLPEREIRAKLSAGTIEMPQDVRRYFQCGLQAKTWRSFYDPILRLPFLRQSKDDADLMISPATVIDYLNAQVARGGKR